MDQLIEFATSSTLIKLLSAAWLALIVLIIYSYVGGALSPIKLLSTHEATLLMNKEDAVVLDIRAANEFKAGHILGSRQLKAEELKEGNFAKLEKSKDKPIIVVCAMGVSAKKTAAQMLKAGFEKVTVLKGGMGAWQAASLPVSK
ncbi:MULTISPECIES: rhodanese-like domain-containing protein [Alteromonadaceae]|jgi:rhodanese-related sulfurtransferase|uniref:Rhodanese-like domain-containing protein n=1 Tax=Brumicola blandensis TaxID=3075611 RepID=A0AAW8QYX4_9ALTE|nr:MULTISPECIES: rhodanese-like domain-containing protein [unclassified Alteromonas]MDT0582363.1 rhodanese-like domain-containing protein [Alteromonas sp. W409]MDT0628585.1 rhodanese-like domain-containing protein [Alteromonas sp. W364]